MEKPKTLFECWAQERNITVEEMRAIIAARIEAGMNDPDPEKRASWERIPRAEEIPHARRMAPLCGRAAGGGRARRPVALVQNLLILALHPFRGIDPLCRKDVHLYQIWPLLPHRNPGTTVVPGFSFLHFALFSL